MRIVSSKADSAGLVGRDWVCAWAGACPVLAGSWREDVEAEADALVEEESGDIIDMDDEVEALEALLRRAPRARALDTVSVFGDGLRLPEGTAATDVSMWRREYMAEV